MIDDFRLTIVDCPKNEGGWGRREFRSLRVNRQDEPHRVAGRRAIRPSDLMPPLPPGAPMVTPIETISPTGPAQFRPQADSGGPWLPPKVPVPGTLFPDRQRWEYGHHPRVITIREPRLLRGVSRGRYRTRCASSLGVLFLSKCPFNVFVLKTFLEFRSVVAEEFHQGDANRLRFIAEPSRLNQSRQLLGDLFRQIDIYGFHLNSVLRLSLQYCTSGDGHFSHLISGARESFTGGEIRRAADFARMAKERLSQ